MSDASGNNERRLRILHVFRSPLGGLFRHVVDLAGEQADRGHDVGLIADSSTGGARADQVLAELAPRLALGLTRFPMRRNPHPADLAGLSRVSRVAGTTQPDVIHGHGSKGALYARLVGARSQGGQPPVRVYTPHGGSLHYAASSLAGSVILQVERLLARRSDLILFESAFAAERFEATIGKATGPMRIVHNGVAPAEFEVIEAAEDAPEFLYIGELRMLKGVDLFLAALAALRATTGRPLRAVLVGSGPDARAFEDLAENLGLGDAVQFTGPQPARQAFEQGQILVVPSRAESLPYIVLEAAAARRPMIATAVGGIPEIFGPGRDALVPGGDAAALHRAMGQMLAMPPAERLRRAAILADHVRADFSVGHMVDGVMEGYREASAHKAQPHRRPALSAMLHLHRSGL